MNLSSNLLMIGERPPSGMNLSIHHCQRFTDIPKNSESLIDVLILHLLIGLSDEAQKHIHILQAKNAALQIVLLANKESAKEDLQEFINKFPIYNILESSDSVELEKSLLLALEKANQLKQNKQLEELVKSQNERLRSLYKELEQRVERRQSFLEEARTKTITANARWQTVLKATEAIQQAETIGEIERSLTEILSTSMRIASTRIFSKPQDQTYLAQHKSQKNYSLYDAPLMRGDDHSQIGSVFFIRDKAAPFRRDETDFLLKIADVVSLAINRLYKLEQTFSFKEHWEATFNAVADPVIILNSNYEVIQSNLAFEKRMLPNQQLHNKTSKKCYKNLFQRESPCLNCHLGTNFRTEGAGDENLTFEVHSQPLVSSTEEQELFVNQYHDVTDQLKMERKIMESARLAELGTIGSSIAHELNNPLGGMLSFAQLIKMDMKSDNPLYEDIVELENGIRRCKDIVQNLLGFTRNPSVDAKTRLDLREVVARALKIMELQYKSLGIEIKVTAPESAVEIDGYFNHLAQALQNILQSALQGLVIQIKKTKFFRGIIEVQLIKNKDHVFINILDNSPVAENPAGIGLSVARQILHDHGGTLELSSNTKPFRMAKVSLPSPVLPA